MALGPLGGARGDYLSHMLLSGHSDSFRKYDKKLLLHRLPTATLMHKFYIQGA